MALDAAQRRVRPGAALRRVPSAERQPQAQEFVELVGLKGFENHYPHELSARHAQAGRDRAHARVRQRRRLMDEPFGPLDAQTRVILQDELLKLWELKRPTVLFVTHDLVEGHRAERPIITFTCRPGTHQAGSTRCGCPDPRDVFHIHDVPQFRQLYDALWDDIRHGRSRRHDDQGRPRDHGARHGTGARDGPGTVRAAAARGERCARPGIVTAWGWRCWVLWESRGAAGRRAPLRQLPVGGGGPPGPSIVLDGECGGTSG
ncbi:hypothetical protein GCM10020220_044810 [Nonomuraea rubra]